MLVKLSSCALVTITLLYGNVPASVAAAQPMGVSPSPAIQHNRLQASSLPLHVSSYGLRQGPRLAPSDRTAPQVYRVDDESLRGATDNQALDELGMARNNLQAAKQKIDELKQRVGELVLQLHAKDTEIAALRSNAIENSKKFREDLASQTEELSQAKRRVTEVEQQMAATAKGQELTQAKRRIAEAEQQTAKKDQDLTQAKRRIAEVEQLTANKELELNQAKRRINEAEQQTAGKEQELLQIKRRVSDAEQQTAKKDQEVVQTKRRVTEVEQQLAGKEQELTQARRRVAEVEQQLTSSGREQELAQAKRRATDAEQLIVKKEQELTQVKDELKQVSQKFADVNPQLVAKEAELARTKQMLVDVELNTNANTNASKQTDSAPAQDEPPPALSLQSIDQTLSASTLLGPNAEAGDEEETLTLIGNSDLRKISESLTSLLQPELKKGTVTVRQRGNKLTLALANGDLFSTGDATVTLGGTSLLERIGAVLHGSRYQGIEVAGHTDNTPFRSDLRKGFRDNQELSRARADYAVQVLINGGLQNDRVKAVGYGDSKPITTNDTDKGRSKNRRLEIVITQTPESGIALGEGKTQVGKKPQDGPHKR
ncbi:MAG: OmpA family protein [Nitrospira sp.]|nr:OmpA family protein [Nitrospira sp.]